MATLVRRLEGRPQAISAAGAVLVHAGFAAFLLQSAMSSRLTDLAASAGADQGAISVSLLRSTKLQAASTLERLDPAPAQTPSAARPAPEAPAQSVQAAEPTRPATPAVPGASPAADSQAGSGAPQAAQADANVGSDYLRRLQARIAPFQRYPDEANRAGIRGVVHLTFQVDRQGRVVGVWVVRSSGSEVLDVAAVDTVHRAEPLPPIPDGLPDAMTIQLPLAFNGPG